MRVVEGVHDWDSLAGSAGVPYHTCENIKKHYDNEDRQKEAVWMYWMNNVPNASWNTLSGAIYYEEESPALERAKQHLQTPTTGIAISMQVDISYTSLYQSEYC